MYLFHLVSTDCKRRMWKSEWEGRDDARWGKRMHLHIEWLFAVLSIAVVYFHLLCTHGNCMNGTERSDSGGKKNENNHNNHYQQHKSIYAATETKKRNKMKLKWKYSKQKWVRLRCVHSKTMNFHSARENQANIIALARVYVQHTRYGQACAKRNDLMRFSSSFYHYFTLSYIDLSLAKPTTFGWTCSTHFEGGIYILHEQSLWNTVRTHIQKLLWQHTYSGQSEMASEINVVRLQPWPHIGSSSYLIRLAFRHTHWIHLLLFIVDVRSSFLFFRTQIFDILSSLYKVGPNSIGYCLPTRIGKYCAIIRENCVQSIFLWCNYYKH